MDIQLCHARGVEKIAWEENEEAHAPTNSLRCLDDPKCGSIFHAPTRVLEFCFAINFRARLLRKIFQVDLRPQGSDTMLPIGRDRKERCLTRGVFPTAPVKPFTEYDVKLLESTDFNTAALDGIMVVGEKTAKQIKFPDSVSQPLTKPLTTPKAYAVLRNLYNTIRHVHGAVDETEIDMVT